MDEPMDAQELYRRTEEFSEWFLEKFTAQLSDAGLDEFVGMVSVDLAFFKSVKLDTGESMSGFDFLWMSPDWIGDAVEVLAGSFVEGPFILTDEAVMSTQRVLDSLDNAKKHSIDRLSEQTKATMRELTKVADDIDGTG